MAGRPVDISKVILVQKLRKQGIPFRKMQKMRNLKGKDLKQLLLWSQYDLKKILKKALDS